MRTTLTLDPDVAAMLSDFRKRHGLGLKETVNQALRRGLLAELHKSEVKVRFTTGEADHGKPVVPNLDDIGEVLERLENGGRA